MREALAEALSDFDGAIVLVSHDRHLIGLVCDRFVRVADGKVEDFDGDLDQYAAWLKSRPGNEPVKVLKAVEPVVVAAKTTSKINPHKLAKAESRVAELESRLTALEAELAEPTLYADGGARATQLGKEQADLRAQLENAELDLLALYEAA